MSTDTPEVEYAFWTPPDSGFSIKYSLPVFQEIEFLVGEGYRRIPHGGVEVGGLLFGQIGAGEIQIDAFRGVECEHASGPSFVLSPKDLDALSQQLQSAAADPELVGMTAVGWFIAHTRSGLQINEREHTLADRFFPNPGSVTVLVKPERFKPTRFAFFVRSAEGQFETAEAQHPILLPSSGKTTGRRVDGAISSVHVPVDGSEASERAGRAEIEGRKAPVSVPKSTAPTKRTPTHSLPQPLEPARPIPDLPPLASSPPPAPEPVPAPQPTQPAVPDLARAPRENPPVAAFAETEDAPMTQAAFEALTQNRPAAPSTQSPRPSPPSARPQQRKIEPQPLSPRSGGVRPNTAILHARPTQELRPPRQQITRPLNRSFRPSPARLTVVLLCAALLGCLVGYYAYSQLPGAVIPLSVKTGPQGLYVSWPPAQTRDTAYAAIRIDDGAPVPLSPEEKSVGGTQISTSHSDTKIELTAQHWLRESRGIVRFVSGVPTASDSAPRDQTPAAAQPPASRSVPREE
jgi:hypothetical protein